MPGFNIGGGNGPSNVVETRRKHRWFFSTLSPLQRNVLILLQKTQRPSFKLDEQAVHHDQEEAWFAGKQHWEPITMSFYDQEQTVDTSKAIWDWLNKVSDIKNATVALPNKYKDNDGKLEMRSGKGVATETWELKGPWPKEVNWNELDYEASDIMRIDVTMRYDRAIYKPGAKK